MVDISFTVVFQWINFGILLFLMTVLLYKPLIKFMDQRANEIRETIKDAEDTRKEAQGVLGEYRKKLAGAAEESRELMEKARIRGEKERSDIVSHADAEARRIMERGRESIELEERKALSRLKKNTVDLSISVASRLIGRELDNADQRRFVEEAIKELEKADG